LVKEHDPKIIEVDLSIPEEIPTVWDETELEKFCKPYTFLKLNAALLFEEVFTKEGVTNNLTTCKGPPPPGVFCTWYPICALDPGPYPYKFSEPGDHIAKEIKKTGTWETNSIRHFLRTMIHEGPEDKMFVDMGANIGIWSFHALLLGFRGVGVEPQPQLVEIIKKTLNVNRLTKNYLLFQNGLSDTSYSAVIEVPGNNAGAAMIGANRSKEVKHIKFDRINLEIIQADDILSRVKAKFPEVKNVTFLKADIESFEVRMLRGASHFLKEYSPRYIFMEITPELGIWTTRQCNCDQFHFAMNDMGYELAEFRKNASICLDRFGNRAKSVGTVIYYTKSGEKSIIF